ncbi:ATP-dependent helicase [Herbidospora yilanensis]|uniref:ATP-dependent helicase n=1 Tax=Herbidospora yilanensis TaxID=354426 RepID=UPI000781F1F9|nr:ATP-dependent helicase [Herbidospora yilanensis]
MTLAPPPLTDEQLAVVTQPADALTLVTAGAGAGKTHTLVRRLDHLVSKEELTAGEILVLTFSRAAARELRDRLARHGDEARYLRVKTFDSWALDVLMRVDATGDWLTRSFDARIEGARQAVEDGLADELFEDLRHVIVDEVQDLVGARRDLVETLLERFDCGFTVVGDPAQSIYGFTVSDPRERLGETNRFFVWLRVTFGEDLVELSLTQNFRARSDEARTALGFGATLRDAAEHGTGRPMYGDLRAALKSSLNLGDLDPFAAEALTGHEGTTAVLCRTNGQALVVSESLHEFGVFHQLRRSARDRVVPAWLTRLFSGDGWTLTRDAFDALELPDADERWMLLRRTGSPQGSDRRLDLTRVRAAIASERLPDELVGQAPARLVVSSFHRAKGLEFDRVVVVDPGPLETTRQPVDPEEEARLLYVAMTRARDDLYWLNAVDTRFIRVDRNSGRWGRTHFQYWYRGGLEVLGGDVLTDQPAGTRHFQADPVELQRHLVGGVPPGAEVTLERIGTDPVGLEESPPYLVVHEDRPIGTTSEAFGRSLHLHLKTAKNWVPRAWPKTISSLRVETLETVAGSEAAGSAAGLGPHGVWLAPRLVGLGRFTWEKEESDDTAN